MKLTMEFEESDLREMIEDYFGSRDFQVDNLDDICAKFAGVFPSGIKVNVSVLKPKRASQQIELPLNGDDSEPEDDAPEVRRTSGDTSPRLTMTELLDPTPGAVSEIEKEMKEILNQSKQLERPE